MHPEVLELTAGSASLHVWPQVGGSLVAWRRGAVALLRPVSLEMMGERNARRLAAFPLIPFSNRIAWGRFSFMGRAYTIRRNTPDHRHPIHGNAWENPWTVQARSGNAVTLAFRHDAVGAAREAWPFSYRAESRIELADDGLVISLAVGNIGNEPMPAGLGLHPFFPADPDTELSFQAESVWLNDSANLPIERAPVPPRWDREAARPIAGMAVDNCFNGWHGRVVLRWPGRATLTMQADPPLGHLVVYVPDGKPYFATEPVSHMNDGINHMQEPDAGIRVLAPGESLQATIRFTAGPG